MKSLIKFAEGIDWFNHKVGYIASWMILLSCLVSAGNATTRKLFQLSSNGALEAQWYMFAATVMLGAAYCFKVNEHVRVDIIYGTRAPRTKAWIDIFGILVFLLPSMYLIGSLSFPTFMNAFKSGEMSSNAGGLIRWPFMLLLPLGCALVWFQGLSELIKRVGFLTGTYNMDITYERPLQ
jgi:TRAP-type mannitol/chloroaromatic compound transport system permease small subunit